MIHVEIDAPGKNAVRRKMVKKVAQIVLDLSSRSDGELTVVLSGDERLRLLNQEFLGKDAPTDVLSFPADEYDPQSGANYIGDVIISIERAAAQAEQFGHDLDEEIMLLVVHGSLHLLGHDHASRSEKTLMWQATREALEKAGLPVSILHE